MTGKPGGLTETPGIRGERHVRSRVVDATLSLHDALERLAAGGRRLVGISFGNPYLAADLPSLSTYLAAYGDQPVMQVAAARALFGETEVTGRLPVTIPGVAKRGAGIQKRSVRP